MHSQHSLQDIKKLVYLKDAVKESSAKHVIKGISQTAGSYAALLVAFESGMIDSN